MEPTDVADRGAVEIDVLRLRPRTHQPDRVARLELVVIDEQRPQVADAVETGAGGEDVTGGEGAQGGVAAGATPADRESGTVDPTGSGHRRSTGDAVVEVDDTPLAAQPFPVVPAVPGRPAVVDVEHREPARGPELHGGLIGGEGLRRRAAVDEDEEGRELSLGPGHLRIGRGIEVAVCREAGAVGPAHLLGARDVVGVDRLGRGGRQDRRGPVGPDAEDLGEGVAQPSLEGNLITVGADQFGVRGLDRDGRQRAVGRVEEGERTGGGVGVAQDEPTVGEEREVTHAQDPLWCGEVGCDVEGLTGGAVLEGPRVPPVRLVGEEPEPTVRGVGRLDGRDSRPSRDDVRSGVRWLREQVLDRRLVEQGRVPGHVGVVPRHPGNAMAVGGEGRPGHEVGPRGQDGPETVALALTPALVAVQAQPDQFVHRLGGAPAVVLTHRVDEVAVDDQAAEAHVPLRREGDRLAAPRVQAPQPVVPEVAEDNGSRRHGIRSAAVFVDARADVPRLREHVRDRVRPTVVTDQDRAPTLPRTSLQPIGVGPVGGDLVEFGLGGRQGGGRDR